MKQSAFLIILPSTGRILRLMLRAELYADYASLRKLTKQLKIKSPHISRFASEFLRGRLL